MSSDIGETTMERLKEHPGPVLEDAKYAERVINQTSDSELLDILVNDYSIDTHHTGDGLGDISQAILSSDYASFDLKKKVATRGDYTTNLDVLVPDNVYKTALGALESGKPVVLYGPTGTGKQHSLNN